MARAIGFLLATALLLCPAQQAAAQEYPSGPIRMLTGFAPGGTADIVARELGAELEKAWRQSVVVENRTGANGAIATQHWPGWRPTATT